MKKAMLLLAGTLALAACAKATPDTSAADEQTIRAEAPAWFAHYNAGHADSVANLYAEDGVVLAPGAPAASGREAIRTFLANDIQQSQAAGLTLNQGEVTGTAVSGDMAWLSATFIVKDKTGATVDNGKYVSVYKRVDGKWLLIRDTWNSDNPAAPAAPSTAPTATTN
jgi:uncharacterized protein (TIGR02246 family)